MLLFSESLLISAVQKYVVIGGMEFNNCPEILTDI